MLRIIINLFLPYKGSGHNIEKMPLKIKLCGLLDKWGDTIKNLLTLMFPYFLKMANKEFAKGNFVVAMVCFVIYCTKKNSTRLIKEATKSFGKIFDHLKNNEARIRSNELIKNLEPKEEREKLSVSIENYLTNIWMLKISYVADIFALISTVYAIYKAFVEIQLLKLEFLMFAFVGIVMLISFNVINKKNQRYYDKHSKFEKEQRKFSIFIWRDEGSARSLRDFRENVLSKEEKNVTKYYYSKFFWKELTNICQVVVKVIYLLSVANAVNAKNITEFVANIAIIDSIFDSFTDILSILIQKFEMINVVNKESEVVKKLL